MPDEDAADKLELLTVNKLMMAEVRVFERMSGYTVQELYSRGQDQPMPSAVIMALAYITEKRVRPLLKPERYERLSYEQLVTLLSEKFEFGTTEDEAEDPTPAA